MKVAKLFLSLFAAMLLIVSANAQNHPTLTQTQSMDNYHAPVYSPSSVSGVLYTQLDSTSGNGYASQQFPDFSNDIGSSADEFVVPAGVTWSIDSIDCIGQFQAAHPNGPMLSVRVFIWSDSGNAGIRPGALVYADSNIIPITGLTTPNPTFKLHNLAVLNPGKYWFSTVVVQNFTVAGQWYWNARPTRGAPCVFRDQANLFGGGTQWYIISTAPNQAVCFRLRGVSTPLPVLPPFSCGTSTYTAITGTPGPVGDDAGLAAPIGFTFQYIGNNYTQVWICTNGFIVMGPTGGTDFTNNLCTTTANETNLLAPFWDDLNTSLGGDIQYTTQGTAPNRVFIVQYTNVAYFSGTGNVTVQVKLYETSNVIDFLYGPAVNNAAATGHIGINMTPGGSGNIIDITPGANCGATTTSTTTCTNVPYAQATGTLYRFGTGIPLGTGNNNTSVPNVYSLSQNYPNPFNPTTVVKYGLPKAGLVKIVVYDILGQEVRTLVNEFKQAGAYDVSFDASSLASGVYLYKIESGDFSQTKKMLLVK